MRLYIDNNRQKLLIIGLIVMSLVFDGSFLLLPFSTTAASLAHAQSHTNTPPEGHRKKNVKRPQDSGRAKAPNRGGEPQNRHGQAPSANVRPDPQHKPDSQARHNPRRNPNNPQQPAHRQKPHAAHGQPYYGHKRPLPPRPKGVRPPSGPGPWQTTPWHGNGPSPWWYGRPFLWTLGTAATVSVIAGITYNIVNGAYYRPYRQGNTTVYVQVDPPRY